MSSRFGLVSRVSKPAAICQAQQESAKRTTKTANFVGHRRRYRKSGYHCRVPAQERDAERYGKRRRLSLLIPGFDQRVWVLLAAMLVFRFGQGLYYPFSTIYFHNTLGIPLSLVGVGLAALAVASVLSGLVSGPLVDLYGRKPLLLLALSGSAASFLAYAFVGGFYGYLAVSAMAGFTGSAMFDAARNAMVADVAPEDTRARAYGLIRVGGNVGWSLGPLAAGLVATSARASATTYKAMFVGAALLVLVVLASLALLVHESLPENGSRQRKVAIGRATTNSTAVIARMGPTSGSSRWGVTSNPSRRNKVICASHAKASEAYTRARCASNRFTPTITPIR